MTERVTIEQNGERFTIDVPDGATDADIQSFVNQQQGQTAAQTETPTAAYAAPQAAGAATRIAAVAPEAIAQGAKQAAGAVGNMSLGQMARGAVDVGSMMAGHPPYASILRQAVDPNATSVKEAITGVGNLARQGAGALGAGARGLGGALVSGAVAPENLFLAPYQMAAMEQEKIRQNPNAPGLESNPYAMTVRGEAPTQRAAGAMNQRSAIMGQQYGGLTPAEQAILEKDRLNMAMRLQAAKKVLGR